MSATNRKTIAQLVPREWHAFIRSGEYAGTRASIQADGSEVPVDFAARLEFVDERRIAIHVALAEDAPRSLTPTPPLTQLTGRERAVVALIAAGRETREIGELLHVSPETVRSHVRNSMSKLEPTHAHSWWRSSCPAGTPPTEPSKSYDASEGAHARYIAHVWDRPRPPEGRRLPWPSRFRRAACAASERRYATSAICSTSCSTASMWQWVACSADGQLTHINRRSVELMGLDGSAGADPDTWIEQVWPRTPEGVRMTLEELPIVRALHGEVVRGVDLLVQTSRGEVLMNTSANPVYNDEGTQVGAVAVFADVTEQRAREAEIRQELQDAGLVVEAEDAIKTGRLLMTRSRSSTSPAVRPSWRSCCCACAPVTARSSSVRPAHGGRAPGHGHGDRRWVFYRRRAPPPTVARSPSTYPRARSGNRRS